MSKILIIEDDTDIRNVYSLVLRHSGYDICTADNGKEGLMEIADCLPDLVLLDIFMPVMDGEKFLRTIKLDKYPNMPVIVCSNTSDESLMTTMVKLGAKKVVTKSSLGPAELTKLVADYL